MFPPNGGGRVTSVKNVAPMINIRPNVDVRHSSSACSGAMNPPCRPQRPNPDSRSACAWDRQRASESHVKNLDDRRRIADEIAGLDVAVNEAARGHAEGPTRPEAIASAAALIGGSARRDVHDALQRIAIDVLHGENGAPLCRATSKIRTMFG